MMQTSKDFMCHIINHGLESVKDGWYITILSEDRVLVEMDTVMIKRSLPDFWKKVAVRVPFNFIVSDGGDRLSLPPKTLLYGIACETGTMVSFELRNKYHPKWCVRGSCSEDGEGFGMVFSTLSVVEGSTHTVDYFTFQYPGKHF